MALPRLAVVFGTYNRLPLLRLAVASIRAAGTMPCDMVIIDGGSTDGTLAWLADQADVVLITQDLPLTGAVAAFNLGFGYAVDAGYEYVGHFNDDAEIVTPGALHEAVACLDANPTFGEVAFAFDLRGSFAFEYVHGRVYGNFGVVRATAGIAVAKAQGDPTGRAWWNPVYRTYGADCEFGCWLWNLGWVVHQGAGLVHDHNPQDGLRAGNEGTDAHNPNRKDSRVFWERWPHGGACP